MTSNGLLETREEGGSSILASLWLSNNPEGLRTECPYKTARNWKRWYVVYVSITIILFFSSLTYGVLAMAMTKEPSRLIHRESLMVILYGLCIATLLAFVVSIVHLMGNKSVYGTELENLAAIFDVTVIELVSMAVEEIHLRAGDIRTAYNPFISPSTAEYIRDCEKTFKAFGI